MATNCLGKKSAFLVVVLLCSRVCEADLVVSAPQFYLSAVRYEAGAEWVQYVWIMPGFGVDANNVVLVEDSAGGYWEPGTTFAQWASSEPGNHAAIRTVVGASDPSALGLTADLLDAGDLWLDYRTENPGTVSTETWNTYYEAQQEGLLDKVQSFMSETTVQLGLVVLLAVGGCFAFLLLRAGLRWAWVTAVVLVFIPAFAQGQGQVYPWEHPTSGQRYWPWDFFKPEDVSQYEWDNGFVPESFGIHCKNYLGPLKGQAWELRGYNAAEPEDATAYWNIGTLYAYWRDTDGTPATADYGTDPGVGNEYESSAGPFGFVPNPSSSNSVAQRTFVHQLVTGAVIRSDETVNPTASIPDGWRDNSFAEDVREWIVAHASLQGDEWNAKLALEGQTSVGGPGFVLVDDPLWDAIRASYETVSEAEWNPTECGVDIVEETAPKIWNWVPDKGGQTMDTALSDSIVDYLVGDVSLMELMGWGELPETVNAETLTTEFAVPLPQDPGFRVSLFNGSLIGGGSTLPGSGLPVQTLFLRGAVRFVVAWVWGMTFLLKCIQVVRHDGVNPDGSLDV